MLVRARVRSSWRTPWPGRLIAAMLCAVLVTALPLDLALASPDRGAARQQATGISIADRFPSSAAAWTMGDGRYMDKDGFHLDFSDRAPNSLWTTQTVRPSRAADVAMEATLQLLSGPESLGYGIAIRATTTPMGGYRLYLNGRGMFALYKHVGEASTQLISWRRSTAINVGQPNTVRLVARGSTLSAFINGQQVGTVEDAEIPEDGAIQLLVGGGQHVLVTSVNAAPPAVGDLGRPDVSTPIFTDQFFDDREGWPASESRYVDEDGYHLVMAAAEARTLNEVWPRTMSGVADLAVEVDLRYVEGPESRAFGVGVRKDWPSGNAYRLFVTAEGSFQLDKHVGSTATTLIPWRRSPALKPGGVANKVKLVASGPNLLVYFNGEFAGAVKDEAVSGAGGIVLLAEDRLHIVARSIVVTDPTQADLAPLRSATPPQPVAPPLGREAIVSAWNDYAWTEGGFSIRQPDGVAPTESRITVQSPSGPVEVVNNVMRVARENALAAQFEYGFTAYPDGLLQGVAPDEVLTLGRNNMLNTTRGTLLSERAVSAEGVPGRETLIALTDGWLLKARTLFVNNRLYHAIAIAPGHGMELAPDVDTFLGSLKLTGAFPAAPAGRAA